MASLIQAVEHLKDRPRKKKGISYMTPSVGSAPVTKRVVKSVFDLNTFESVQLGKDVTLDPPVSTIEEALARLSNDPAALLAIVNEGLVEKAVDAARNSSEGFQVIGDEDEFAGPFTGTPANEKLVDTLVLNIAKSVFGYVKIDKPEIKQAKKTQARELIKSNEVMRAGLAANAGK